LAKLPENNANVSLSGQNGLLINGSAALDAVACQDSVFEGLGEFEPEGLRYA
jgi:hypothetical protein